MRQTTPGGADERLNSARTDREKEQKRERKRERETEKRSWRIDLHMMRATAQKHDSELDLSTSGYVVRDGVIALFRLVKARGAAKEREKERGSILSSHYCQAGETIRAISGRQQRRNSNRNIEGQRAHNCERVVFCWLRGGRRTNSFSETERKTDIEAQEHGHTVVLLCQMEVYFAQVDPNSDQSDRPER